MLYYLAQQFAPLFGPLNVLTYHTVRAGGALITGFFLSLILGPKVLDFLRAIKVGQFIKKDHVQDLHELHKGKSGTPTMGGVLIILTTLISLALWSSWTNRLLLVATGVLVLMGIVGFLDDYIKLRRKHNDGLSARAKTAGQVLVGTLLGVYVVFNPTTYGASYLSPNDIQDWPKMLTTFRACVDGEETGPVSRFVVSFDEELRTALREREGYLETRRFLLDVLNETLERRDLYEEALWVNTGLNGESHALMDRGIENLNKRQLVRFNRLLIEAAAPDLISRSTRNLQTKVAVPGFKDLLLPMGGLIYVVFVVLIIVATSNGVNLTDGLDGLAAGTSVVAISAFTALAYVVSRADWSNYLFVMYIPEASELTVLGGALLGTGLGFLWFNAHPAEVFMGDTGSLALGGVMGAMAVLLKQELLLPIVGGLFVIETLSVIIQVASFKLTGKRVFRMAPIHHHFELKGWSESKVTIRFWIMAFMFALLSLSTLKLR